MITTIKTQKARLMMLSLAFTFFLFINNSFAFALPDSTRSCDVKKGPSVSKTDSTHKGMKMENMSGGMHKEMMAKNDSTSSCKNKNKEGMRESSVKSPSDVPSGKEMAMADCKMKDKDDEKKDCKMEDSDKKDCKMKEAETKEGKEEHESHHKGDSGKSVN